VPSGLAVTSAGKPFCAARGISWPSTRPSTLPSQWSAFLAGSVSQMRPGEAATPLPVAQSQRRIQSSAPVGPSRPALDIG
jgi:hypothetical protein